MTWLPLCDLSVLSRPSIRDLSRPPVQIQRRSCNLRALLPAGHCGQPLARCRTVPFASGSRQTAAAHFSRSCLTQAQQARLASIVRILPGADILQRSTMRPDRLLISLSKTSLIPCVGWTSQPVCHPPPSHGRLSPPELLAPAAEGRESEAVSSGAQKGQSLWKGSSQLAEIDQLSPSSQSASGVEAWQHISKVAAEV